MQQLRASATGAINRMSPVLQDLLLAVLLTAFTQWEISEAPFIEGELWVHRVSFAVVTLSIAVRRWRPLLAAVICSAGLAAQTGFGGEAPAVGGFLATILVTHSVALYSARREALIGLAVVLAAVHTYTFMNLDEFRLADEIGNAAIFIMLWALGRAVRFRQHRAESAEAQTARVEAEREQQTQAAIADERARIARELHDVVAHGVSLMVLQTSAARQVLDSDPERAREPLLAVEDSGRQALAEMHRLLALLRPTDDGELPPTAGLDQLEVLAEQMRAAGLPTTVTVEGTPRALPPSVDLSAYRIVQEALTNALRHAGPGASTKVLVRHTPDAVDLEVADTGSGGGDSGGDGGFGLAGMRERVRIFGGELHAGPRDNGPGWVVRARLPAGATGE